MSQSLLNAAWQLETMIGREEELEQIRKAIYPDGNQGSCRIVLVTGPGGIGKSRLLEEVLRRAGNPAVIRARSFSPPQLIDPSETWSIYGEVTVSDVIDLMDIRLSSKVQLIEAIHNALSWSGGVDFSAYEQTLREYERAKLNSASFTIIADLEKQVEEDFWRAFQEHTQGKRIVLMLDTAERLVLRSSDWVIKNHLLTPGELVISSQQWLITQVVKGRFDNTTLILAGRPKEGKPFFSQFESILTEEKTPCEPVKVSLKPLSREETGKYFGQLAKEWDLMLPENRVDTEDHARIGRSLRALAEDKERLDILHLMTGGRPVLLSLYSDLIHEPGDLPGPFLLSKSEVEQALKGRREDAFHAEIEDAFIDLLFEQPGLRSDIMQALARCPAGLSARQLHYLIDSKEGFAPAEWVPNVYRLQEIKENLDQIRQLSIARPRRNDPLNIKDINDYRRSQQYDDTQRMGLQDEIYRIYADRNYAKEGRRDREHQERTKQYKKLQDWAGWQLDELRKHLRDHQEADERRLTSAIQLPTQAVTAVIPRPLPSEQEERNKIQRAIAEWELERLHYSLLANPAAGLNDDYTDLTEQRWLANNEEADFIGQQEMWRVLHDDHALKFSGMNDDQLEVLQRTAREEDPTRWIKRFILRRQYKRAITFYDSVEKAIEKEPEAQRITWKHPLNAGERIIWTSYARIMLGTEAQQGVKDIVHWLGILTPLAKAPSTEKIGPKGETGFKDHPALPRLLRIIAVGHNFAGYGYVVRSQFTQAIKHYGKGLRTLRETKIEARHAATLNNLGRALASQGKEERGLRICADALEIRRSLGAEIPVAYSLNTLALIGNSMQRTPTAWREAAQAAAIFRQAGDNRGLGLALIQVGIGLRRLAKGHEPSIVMEAGREELYRTAQDALERAVEIFGQGPELLRLVEAELELGCVLRDQIRLIDPAKEETRWLRATRQAEKTLVQAIELAEKNLFPSQALQARVDLAWAYFFMDDHDKAEAVAQEAETQIPAEYHTQPNQLVDQKDTEAHYFYQLAKIQGLYGSIAMKRFKERREDLRREKDLEGEQLSREVERDKTAQTILDKSAECYVLSLFYGQMFSPRSRSLVITFDHIYDHIKSFNEVEHRMFYEAQEKATKKYQEGDKESDASQPNDFSNLQKWLNDCFGLSEDENG